MISIATLVQRSVALFGCVAVTLGASTAVRLLFSDQSCKEGTIIEVLTGSISGCDQACDDVGLTCSQKTTTGSYPLFSYCACGLIGDPQNGPVCHAFLYKESDSSAWVFKCSKGSCADPQKCWEHVVETVPFLKQKCICKIPPSPPF